MSEGVTGLTIHHDNRWGTRTNTVSRVSLPGVHQGRLCALLVGKVCDANYAHGTLMATRQENRSFYWWEFISPDYCAPPHVDFHQGGWLKLEQINPLAEMVNLERSRAKPWTKTSTLMHGTNLSRQGVPHTAERVTYAKIVPTLNSRWSKPAREAGKTQ